MDDVNVYESSHSVCVGICMQHLNTVLMEEREKKLPSPVCGSVCSEACLLT
jgi:hypothetical protein